MNVAAANYELKWHSFGTHLHSSVALSLQSEMFTDVALVTIDGHQFMAHRFILSANSQYFQQVLTYHTKVTTTLPLVIILPSEINHKTLKILLMYMYSGEVTVPNDILENVLRGGDILKVRGLYRMEEDENKDKRVVKIVNPKTPKLIVNPHTQAQQKIENRPQVIQQVGSKIQNPVSTQKQYQKLSQKDMIQLKNAKDKQKVINYPLSVRKFEAHEPEKQPKLHESRNKRIDKNKESRDDADGKDEGYLVIKEEPIEWNETSEMEIVDEQTVFNTEITVKSESEMMEESSEAQSSNDLYSPLTCELCTQTFSIPAEWVRHVQTHTDMLPAKRQRRDRPEKDDENTSFPSLLCDMCEKTFPTPAEWVRHIQDEHTEFELHMANKKKPTDRPKYGASIKDQPLVGQKSCSECKKVFPSHASMLIHKRTHTGEKPYACEFCMKGFNVKSNLLRHLRTLHNTILNPNDVESMAEENSAESD